MLKVKKHTNQKSKMSENCRSCTSNNPTVVTKFRNLEHRQNSLKNAGTAEQRGIKLNKSA